MECRRCGASLERPGDFCLVCRSSNADAVVLSVDRDRATIWMLDGEDVVGETAVTTRPESGTAVVVELRNFAGRIADEIHRKRPETVYASGDRAVIESIRGQLHYELYRVRAEDPVGAVLSRRGDRELAVVDTPPRDKIGGAHSTLIGGRDGQRAVSVVLDHPHVKKLIPGPIDAGGSSSRGSVRAKVTRSDDNGNLRLLIRDGSSVQENRVVTTAMDRETGEWVRDDLNEALRDSEVQ